MVFSPIFDPKNNTIELNGAMVSLHCHHYNCGLLKAIEEIPGIDVHDIFIKTSAEEFFKNFKTYLANNGSEQSLKNCLQEASELYRSMGFGRINLDNVGEVGGIAYSDSSYFVAGWLAKYGRRGDPVCFLTCGFIAGILAAIFNVSSGDYAVRETECLVSGSYHCKFVISRN